MDFYDKDYYENGLVTGKSCYQNYKWLPEETISLAMRFIDYLGITQNDLILDFGCAKGFLVKAFRLLHRQSFGYDISSYAISCVPENVKQYCFSTIPDFKFNFCISKDVFEHINEIELYNILLNLKSDILFAIIPLGNNGVYRSKINELDKSHILCYNEDKWIDIFNKSGWHLKQLLYEFFDIKKGHPLKSHGFFILEKKV